MKKPLVAVLGCGPSGLLAAHTLEGYGIPTAIFSRKVKSVLGGAQFSHIGIPGLTDPEATLTYVVRGDAETYQRKVYGSADVPFVSFENVKNGLQVPAWNLRKMYDMLWERLEAKIIDVSLDGDLASRLPTGFDAAFSSVPAPVLCAKPEEHWFRQQTIRIFNAGPGDAAGVGADNTIVYDGTEETSWYRASRIFGVASIEWGAAADLPPVELRTVHKPVATNCDCHPHLTRIGRFGTWTKGVLTFHAYNKVVDVLAEDWGIAP